LDYEVPGLRADANGPYSSKPGKSIQFHGDADGGEPPYSWHWKFGDGDASNQQSPIHVYTSSGTYPVTLTVTDSTGDTDTDRTTATANNPPNKPKKPSGPTSGRTGISYTYSTSATDPDRDRVRYCFNWGTVYITCTNLVESGKTASKSHRWYTPGTYHVKAMTRDENGGRSGWSDCLTVTISSNPPYTPSNPSPQNNATNVYIDTDLRWKGGDPDGDIVYYDVYFKAGSVPSESDIISSSQTETKFDPGILENDTHYFWKIVATDEYGETTKGPIWNFWTGDTIPPEINITRPMNGLYIANKEMMPIGRTIIIGKITIKVNATDASGIDRVEFYIDNESKNNDTATPYEWEWDEMAFFGHSIKVVAYDKAGNTASDEIDVIIFNI
jgi:PKD repeat protein